jgi:hypothetical protein
MRQLAFAGPGRVRLYYLDFTFGPQPSLPREMVLSVSELTWPRAS